MGESQRKSRRNTRAKQLSPEDDEPHRGSFQRENNQRFSDGPRLNQIAARP